MSEPVKLVTYEDAKTQYANECIVALLEDWLARAKAGEWASIHLAGMAAADRGLNTNSAGIYEPPLVAGALLTLAVGMLTNAKESM